MSDPDLYWKASTAVLAAAETVITTAGLTVPKLAYVSTRGLDFLETSCGCDQLVVIPGLIEDPGANAILPDKASHRHRIEFAVLLGQSISDGVTPCKDLGTIGEPCADPFVGPTAPVGKKPPSILFESWQVSRARWVLWTGIKKAVAAELCACFGPRVCSGSVVTRIRIEDETGGGCEWSKLTLSVVL